MTVKTENTPLCVTGPPAFAGASLPLHQQGSLVPRDSSDDRRSASGGIDDGRAESAPALVFDKKTRGRIALRTYCGQKKPATAPPFLSSTEDTGADQWRDDEQIAQFLPLVHKIARRVAVYLKPPLSFEDLVSAGAVGLVKAARNFDSSQRAEFKTYAYIRIKGAILDELRSLSLLPANLNKQVQNARQLCQKIAQQTGIVPTDEEIAEKLGITVDEVYQLFEKARAQHFVCLDDFEFPVPAAGAGRDIATPDKQLERAELVDKLTQAIQQLDQRRRQIILLYYQQHLTMKQIAQLLKITESRVSQLHASAIFNLSIKLRQWKDGK